LKKLGLALVLVASGMLVACGGGGGGDGGGQSAPLVGSSNLSANMTSSSAAAVAGESFTFSSGVTDFNTTSPTTVSINSTSTFSVSATEGTASGNLTFGSCIFTVTSSTFPVGSPLAVGGVVTVHPCTLTVATQGLVAEANAVQRAVSFVLAGNASQSKDMQVDIIADGSVIVDGVTIGTVTLTAATGGSGG
jgi:hypothetical protein